jgi:hypothetical protein
MKTFSVWYRYNGLTNEFRFEAEGFEQARERVLVFKASKEDEPRLHCLGDATPKDELAPFSDQMTECKPHESQTSANTAL